MEKATAGSPAMNLATVCIAQFMAPFMLTSVGVALPSLGRELGASAMQPGLVAQLYVLSLAMSMLTFGRFGDIVGQRRLFLAGLCVFTLFTFILGFAHSIRAVMGFRFAQGVGASMVLSGSMALVAAAYPPQLRARKIGVVSACTYTGPSTGPVIGGYVTLHFGWRHVFLMSVPIGLAAIGVCLFGMAVSLTTISLIFSLFMGAREITPVTLPAFLMSMRTGLVAYAVFSALGVILSVGRGKKGSGPL